MDFFSYKNGGLYAEDVAVADLAETFGTPLYIYSASTLTRHYKAYEKAFAGRDSLICYAVKANSNIAIIQHLARLGAGFDIVSGGELARVLAAGGEAKKIIFSGVAKSEAEILQALEAGILCFNVESSAELERISQVARKHGYVAPISLRINPNVDAKTHPYISTGLKDNKFGIPAEEALEVYLQAAKDPSLEVVGVDCHIGSQLTDITPYIDAIKELKKLITALYDNGIKLHHLDIGGGLGVSYSTEAPPLPAELLTAVYKELEDLFRQYGQFQIIVEPGRSIVANAGILVTKVEYLKHNYEKNFCIVDAGMNDLIRPSLYGSFMNIINVDEFPRDEQRLYDVVGPVCESSDFLGKNRQLKVHQGSLLAVRGAGAYAMSMSSQYNSRPRPAEILVENEQVFEIRARETYQDIWEKEKLLP